MGIAPFGLLGLGFLLGVRHAFDIDHAAAVSTMVKNNSSLKSSSLVGMFWGLGHTMSLLVAGVIVLLLGISIPQKMALSLDFIIGAMLILLGINAILTVKKNKIHMHKHKHGQKEHLHFHSHKLISNHEHEHMVLRKSLLVGLIHGLAGSAGLTLLVLAAIKSFWTGFWYILIFGVGSIIGMMAISSIISLPFALIPNKLEKARKMLGIGTGLTSTIIGLIMIYNIVFIGGLIT